MKLFQLEIDENRIYGLDILRAIAILIVVLVHGTTLVPPFMSNFYSLINIDGVCIFFVLSGFLIGNVLIKTIEKHGFNSRELLNFWIRRWARTLPNYYLFLLILIFLNKIFIEGFPLKVTPQYFIFSQNIISGSPGFFGEAWSLSIEEWFYITTPIIIYILLKFLKTSVKTSIIFTALLLVICSIIFRIILYGKPILDEMGDYDRIVLFRIDSIMYGVIGAFISFYYKNFWFNFRKISFVLGIIIILTIKVISLHYSNLERWFYVNYFYPILCIGILCILPLLSNYRIAKHSIFTKFITVISLISYSLYLIHNSLIRKLLIENIFKDFFSDNSLLIMILKNSIYWFSSILLSIIIFKYYERPLMKLRNLYKPTTRK